MHVCVCVCVCVFVCVCVCVCVCLRACVRTYFFSHFELYINTVSNHDLPVVRLPSINTAVLSRFTAFSLSCAQFSTFFDIFLTVSSHLYLGRPLARFLFIFISMAALSVMSSFPFLLCTRPNDSILLFKIVTMLSAIYTHFSRVPAGFYQPPVGRLSPLSIVNSGHVL